MVQRALSHRRGARTLEVDTTPTAAGPSTPPYVTIPVIVRTGSTTAGRRESLPLSRHHMLRRSSSVSGRSTAASSSSSSGFNVTGFATGRLKGAEMYDQGSVIVDVEEELGGSKGEGH
ncbi:hypothetical protein N657DRAFT_644258 [Parathielavia appendiculata]|uniref:Uncharacterized protein n=1 Tax=Parathielavia appendiculata TaxID=2587402 RepID=A0AAN6U0C2_9PEZI|nr:hypothetical protein N657DRAFT_644258 [Parathielavia appendiculata]